MVNLKNTNREENKQRSVRIRSVSKAQNCVLLNSCEIVALRENFIGRQESYDSYSAKSCILLAHEKKAHGLGYISPFPYTIWPKAMYQKIPKTFSYCARSITNLTNIWHHPELLWKSHTWIFRLSFAVFEISMFGHLAMESKTL
jgi:hypothetical protein